MVDSSESALRISVVIPTYNRPDSLRACVNAVLAQDVDGFEVVIANDGTIPVPKDLQCDPRVVVLNGPFGGPAAARNAGIQNSTGDLVAFTDDDAVPQAGWLRAALDGLAGIPEVVGMIGQVDCPPYDPVFEHAVQAHGLGNFLTCNAVYRRWALKSVSGFDEGFPYPHCEDRDLGYRMSELGTVLYVPSMLVHHPAVRERMRDVAHRGRFVASEWRLHRKHPQSRPPRWSVRWGPLMRSGRSWYQLASKERVLGDSPIRAVRFVGASVGELAVATWTTLTAWAKESRRPIASGPQGDRLRVAYVGPTPRPGGGVAGCAWLILEGLSQLDCQVDCYVVDEPEEVPAPLLEIRDVRVICVDTGWRWNHWYSNRSVSKFISGSLSLAFGRLRVGRLLVQNHRVRPYDVVYQFSSIEMFGLSSRLGELPPIVLHPQTHAAGEYRWHHAERNLTAGFEPAWRRTLVRRLLGYRARRQRRDAPLGNRIVAISGIFGAHLVADCQTDRAKMRVIPSPVDLDGIRPRPRTDVTTGYPLRILFVGRMASRKGVDQVVALSHLLADLAGEVVIDCIGDFSLWSDYRPLLSALQPEVAVYHGPKNRGDLLPLLRAAAMLIQPSKYEPFGLTVAEALASGVPVVASTEVGAAEHVDPACCLLVEPGDVQALEGAVRAMLERITNDGPRIRAIARQEAERLFSPDQVARDLVAVLREVSGKSQAYDVRDDTCGQIGSTEDPHALGSGPASQSHKERQGGPA